MHLGGGNGQDRNSNSSKGSKFFQLIKGIIIGLLFSIIFLVMAVTIFYFTPLSENYIPLCVFAISVVGIIISSFHTGKSIGTHGWLNGGLVGLGYVLVLVCLGEIVLEEVLLDYNIFSKMFIGFVIGLLGGVWGVNS